MKVKSRKYELAINNPKAHDMCHDNIKNIVPKIAQVIYWCMSDEIGLETQTYHTHIFIQFQNEVQFSTIKKYFPMAHIEIAKASPYENRDYIFKLGKWENDPKCHTKIDGTQEEFGTIPQGKSHRRYQRDYERYIKGTSFDHLLISTITPIDIEKFLKSIVSTYNLGGRSLTNIMGYLRSNMVYACKRELLTTNPCLFVELAPIKGFCKTTRQKDSERILSNEDMAKLIATLHQKQSEDELYIQNYAIELATMCGMRVGELSALKWECVEDKVLRIEYSEHRLDFDDKPCEYYIDETKNRKVREFPMTSAMKNFFERIREVQKKYGITSEFVFANKEGRVNSHTITCAMTRRCEDANIDVKSIHAIRRTISSHLRTILSIASVASLLGHLEETNEKHYNYDILTQKIKLECVTQMYETYSKVA